MHLAEYAVSALLKIYVHCNYVNPQSVVCIHVVILCGCSCLVWFCEVEHRDEVKADLAS
jgi:hypothetical protein